MPGKLILPRKGQFNKSGNFSISQGKFNSFEEVRYDVRLHDVIGGHQVVYSKKERTDCKTVGFFAKSIKKSVKRSLFDCSRVLEYAKIRTVLQSTFSQSLS